MSILKVITTRDNVHSTKHNQTVCLLFRADNSPGGNTLCCQYQTTRRKYPVFYKIQRDDGTVAGIIGMAARGSLKGYVSSLLDIQATFMKMYFLTWWQAANLEAGCVAVHSCCYCYTICTQIPDRATFQAFGKANFGPARMYAHFFVSLHPLLGHTKKLIFAT